MKMKLITAMVALIVIASSPAAMAQRLDDSPRDQSAIGKMMHKLGRGVTNVLTSWVEIPRQVAREWERTDPATGLVVGSVKGVGWGFARFATGVYETFTFPFPVPADYQPMLEPEFVITDVWGEGIPDITDLYSNDPTVSGGSTPHPQPYRF